MHDSVINVQGLTKDFANGARALNGLDLLVRAGETLVLLGANGSGRLGSSAC